MVPEELRYTAEHEWVAPAEGGGCGWASPTMRRMRWATSSSCSFLRPGPRWSAGEPMGEIESTKSVSELYAPVSGGWRRSTRRSLDAPEVINTAPYGEGWLVEIRAGVTTAGAVESLLDAAAYRRLTDA